MPLSFIRARSNLILGFAATKRYTNNIVLMTREEAGLVRQGWEIWPFCSHIDEGRTEMENSTHCISESSCPDCISGGFSRHLNISLSSSSSDFPGVKYRQDKDK